LVVVREILCKSVLNRCGIENIDYSVNPYVGCEHGCIYCYARYMRYYSGHRERWGEFVDVKINAPLILAKEIYRKPRGHVILSTVTDPYQPLERRYRVTENCLKKLLRYDFPVSILTKSSLVLRDIDLLAKFNHCEVGMTIITGDEKLKRFLEPRSSSIKERLDALKKFSEIGIPTYVFVGPIIPSINDEEEDLRKLTQKLLDAEVDRVMFDHLNPRYGVTEQISRFLEHHFPHLLSGFLEKMRFSDEFYREIKHKFSKIMNEYEIPYEFCF